MTPAQTQPEVRIDPAEPTRARLLGNWTLASALEIGKQLQALPEQATVLDATEVGRIDSAGVLALMRHANRRHLAPENLHFRQDHKALVSSIEDVADDRPKRSATWGFWPRWAGWGSRSRATATRSWRC